MPDNFIELKVVERRHSEKLPNDDIWMRRAAKVLSAYLYNSYERDWMELANCIVDDPEDKSFIDKPGHDETLLAIQCAHCPVFSECKDWADREEITGVYVAGEWRD